jgi:succinylglutamic semialdehyde dehydrogenase
MHSLNPATGETLWTGSAADAAAIDAAFIRARVAFEAWCDTPFEIREALVLRFAALLQEHKNRLAEIIARETGKTLADSQGEMAAMIGKIAISIRAYHERTGSKTLAGAVAGLEHRLQHRPHGVLAVFGPYNFPAHLPNGHIVPALLAGNVVVFKPSELTPLVAEETFKLWQQAGLPDGVLQVLQGERDTGAQIAAHPELDGLLFTGSAKVGHLLHRQLPPHKLLALELGGNNPLIVREGVDVAGALHDIVQSAFVSSGQRCTCTRRLLLPRGAWGEALLESLLAVKISVGAWNEAVFMGPLISEKAATAVIEAQNHWQRLGARVLKAAETLPQGACFVSHGIVDTTGILVPDEETFGPLLQVVFYSTFEEALHLANHTRYGLSAGLLSNDADDWARFQKKIRAGVITWNRPTTGASSALPFGGVKDSGNHRASAFYAADYCAWPMSSTEQATLRPPASLPVGLNLG